MTINISLTEEEFNEVQRLLSNNSGIWEGICEAAPIRKNKERLNLVQTILAKLSDAKETACGKACESNDH